MINSSVLLFLNLGGGEVFIIVLVVLLLFGSDQLPQLVKGLGRGIREINDAKDQIQNEIQNRTKTSTEEIKKHTTDIQNEISQVEQTIKRQVNSFLKEDDDVSKQ